MSLVRYLISRQDLPNGGVIMRYEVEAPKRPRIGRLVELELHLSPGATAYYADMPRTFVVALWDAFISDSQLILPSVLFHSVDPEVSVRTPWKKWGEGIIVVEVETYWDWMARPPEWPIKRIMSVVEDLRLKGWTPMPCHVYDLMRK